jgi:hypothetical protein
LPSKLALHSAAPVCSIDAPAPDVALLTSTSSAPNSATTRAAAAATEAAEVMSSATPWTRRPSGSIWRAHALLAATFRDATRTVAPASNSCRLIACPR